MSVQPPSALTVTAQLHLIISLGTLSQKEDQVGAIDVRADLVDRGGKFLLLGVVHLS